MSYQVLARKWRPHTFAELVGQEHVVAAISNALENDRLHHAYLFTGTRGVGKTTIARIFSKSLNCEQGQSATPCGQCPTCKEIEHGNYVDLLEIDAASRTKVEDTRDLLDNVQYKPTRGRFKVYLIDEVHMLSKHSFNALLKTLEEPPPHVKFLLATTDPQKLPVTILSRCLQFNLKALSRDQIVAQLAYILKHEAIHFEESALALLARAAQGSMRDALSLTDQAIAQGNNQVSSAIVTDMLGLMDRHQLLKLLYAVVQKQPDKVMELVATIAEQAPDYGQMLAEISSLLHQVALTQWIPDACKLETTSAKAIFKLAQQLPSEQVQLMYQIALQGRKDLPYAVDGRSGTEMTLLRMMAFAPAHTLEDSQEAIVSGAPTQVTVASGSDEYVAGSAMSSNEYPTYQPDNNDVEAPEYSAPTHLTQNDVLQESHEDAEPSRTDPTAEPSLAHTERHKPSQAADVPTPTSTKEMLELRQRLKRSRKEEAENKVKKSEASLHREARPSNPHLDALTQPDNGSTSKQVKDSSAAPDAPTNNDDSPPPWVTDIPYAEDGDNAASGNLDEPEHTHTQSAYSDTPGPGYQPEERTHVPDKDVESNPGTVDCEKTELSAYLSDGTKLLNASQIDKWSALVEQMSVAGLIKQIALHSAMKQVEDEVTLEMDPSQQHLLNDSAISQLEQALSSALGQAIRLHVEIGKPQQTPFSLQQSINEMRQRHARQVVERDDIIQSLSDAFNATVLPDSIQAR